MAKTNSISKFTLILVIVICAWYGKNLKKWEKNSIINHDVIHYYAYFPATFIYNDWSFDFRNDLPEDFEGRIWLLKTPEGKPVLKMTMGLSMLWLPFELVAHGYAKVSHFRADGYTKPYSFAIFIANLVYLFWGLFFLRKLLLKYFHDISVAIVLFLVVLSTNLMHYVIAEPGMAHVYNFSLIALFLYLTDRWLQKPKWFNSIALGVTFGMIGLIRPVNAVVGIVPLLWGISNLKGARQRLSFFVTNWKMILVVLVGIFLINFPQFLYWKVVTGHWIYYSYQDEGFFLNNPNITNGLFSYRKGWLIYTPVMALALSGFFFLRKFAKGITIALLATMAFAVYIVYSWWTWWYGGGFGSRPMIDFYALMAIPLAAVVQYIIKSRWWLKLASVAVIGFLVYLNQFQMNQYRTSLLHWDSMTKEAYWAIMFEKQWPPNYTELIKSPDYDKAMKGEDEYSNL